MTTTYVICRLPSVDRSNAGTQEGSLRGLCESDEELRGAIDAIANGAFSHGDRELFKPIVENLLGSDPYMLLADYRSYIECQEEVGQVWSDRERWTRSSILNVARTGWFSSDRAVREYCRSVWHIEPVPIPD